VPSTNVAGVGKEEDRSRGKKKTFLNKMGELGVVLVTRVGRMGGCS